ncbi:DeoR family transcriptional regulator [Scytonema sp. UIC 10036]|uniref:DeoR/GlpR family DNA-binding transcription regulator n=1 Tax=Scytonema sp. UIC 10036 TaxID=2304196 RepID=UPI0012DAA007|nr:DeoR/GlpR family DNA-binding transcription regulator [Scytonema sp. UIC 10036]MUG92394.1 DeoR family transcriptional regulator [Scytonema sp. UIC 10036]
MLNAERKQFILESLRREGKVLSSDLSNHLNVSEDTIRRDLRDLAEAGLLMRVHGGALPVSGQALTYTARQSQAQKAKVAIGKAAAGLVRRGQVVLLDGGTTTLQVVEYLPKDLHATIITHSPPIAVALVENSNIEVILLGGRLLKNSLVAVGAATVDTLRSIRADLCLLGVRSLHPDMGIGVLDLEEAYVKRAMMDSSAEVVALASEEKLGTAAPYIVGAIAQLTHLVTENTVSEQALQPYKAAGITIIRA